MGLPLTAVVARHDIERVSRGPLDAVQPRSDHFYQTQAWIFVVGSSASTSTTIAFLYIIFRFPVFIQQVKLGGAAPDVVVRLAIFYSLNVSTPSGLMLLINEPGQSESVSYSVSYSRFPSSSLDWMHFGRHIESSRTRMYHCYSAQMATFSCFPTR